jgi:hypothetical protein
MSEAFERLAERQRIEDRVVKLFVATDERDWAGVESCLADPVTIDMTSMVGGAPLRLRPAEVSAAWAEGFRTLDHVHHQVGNFRTRIDGDAASVQCYGIALHHRAAIAAEIKTRRFVGSYDFELQRASGGDWRIGLLRFNLKFIDGHLELEKAG